MDVATPQGLPAWMHWIALLLVLLIAAPRRTLAAMKDAASSAITLISTLGLISLVLAYFIFLLTLICGFIATKDLLFSSSEHRHVPILLAYILAANVIFWIFGAGFDAPIDEMAEDEHEDANDTITTTISDIRALISAAVRTATEKREDSHGKAIADLKKAHDRILKDLRASNEAAMRAAQKSHRLELAAQGKARDQSSGGISERLAAAELTISTLTKENSDFKSEVLSYESIVEEFGQSMIEVEEKRDQLKAKSVVDEKSIADLQDVVVGLDAAAERSLLNTEKLERLNKTLKLDVEGLEDKVAELEERIEDLEEQIEDEDVDSDSGEKDEAIKEMGETIAAKSQEIVDMEAVLEERSKEIADLAQELDEHIDERVGWRVQIDELKGDNWNLEDQAKRHAAQLEENDKIIQSLREELARAKPRSTASESDGPEETADEESGAKEDDEAGDGSEAEPEDDEEAESESTEEAEPESGGEDGQEDPEEDFTEAAETLIAAAGSADDSSDAEEGIIVDESDDSATEPLEEEESCDDEDSLPPPFATTVEESQLFSPAAPTVLLPVESSYPPAPESPLTLHTSSRVNYIKKPSAAKDVILTEADMRARTLIPADRIENTIDTYTGRDEFTGHINELSANYGTPDPLQADPLWSKCPYRGHNHHVADCIFTGGKIARVRPTPGSEIDRHRISVKLPPKE